MDPEPGAVEDIAGRGRDCGTIAPVIDEETGWPAEAGGPTPLLYPY